MSHTTNTLVLTAALAAASGFALGRVTSPSTEAPAPTSTVVERDPSGLPPGHPPTDMPPANPHPQPPGAVPGVAAPASQDNEAIRWTKPAAWNEVPNPNSMRLATYLVPSAPGESTQAELAVSRAGGSLDANIERWAGQFGEEGKSSLKRESREVNGLRVTVVTTSGSSFTGMNGEVKKGDLWQMLAAIVESPDGSDQAYFFKMTGSKKNVDAARADFDALIASLRKP